MNSGNPTEDATTTPFSSPPFHWYSKSSIAKETGIESFYIEIG